MKINVVSFAEGRFIESQKILEEKSYLFGASKVYSYGIQDLKNNFIKKNKKAFDSRRGFGYWIWKPYVILKAFNEISDGEILLYIDSGAYPINNLTFLPIEENVVCFEMYHLKSKDWTKYDCYYKMNCLEEKYFFSNRKLAGFQIYKKNNFSKQFIEEYLYYCEIDNNICITDEENLYGNNLEGFREHRHDQSVYSNLCVKYNLKPHRDPSQWGNNDTQYYSDKYPQIFNLHRGNI
jgi:hypothetical protein